MVGHFRLSYALLEHKSRHKLCMSSISTKGIGFEPVIEPSCVERIEHHVDSASTELDHVMHPGVWIAKKECSASIKNHSPAYSSYL